MRITDSTVNLISERRYRETYSISHEKGIIASSLIKSDTPDFRKILDAEENKEEQTLFTNYNADGEFSVQDMIPSVNKMTEIESIRMKIMERLLNIMQILYGSASGSNKSRMQEYMRGLSSQMNQGSFQWMSVSTTTYIHTEFEQTAFQAQGIAKTEDGRELNFGINLCMSRQFTESVGIMQLNPVQLMDPLVINVGSGVTEISDQTFTFDLDSDGEAEEVKNITSGSGFLAYDKNGDGIINNGTELFGARTGNGFAELSEYDNDGNGWIDEADKIYENLRVWCRGEDGKDTLMTLKEADVGAIYLGHAETNFTSQGTDFMVNARFRASGIFLHESSGDAGSVHQIDLAKMA
ncbi:hypothetical protein [Butyrivibrio sp. AC2005]|uniref:hypothetical protein n=1 Tax=Butyrivibrio sp. AC2005 TaxID=1280672 RepID=UPI00041B45F4|nr:hypothetical protein [Butyrivibrio sp. AC2005]